MGTSDTDISTSPYQQPSSKRYQKAEYYGTILIEWFHLLGLFTVGIMIVWASFIELGVIFKQLGPSIKDILLLFIYLELGAMVGVYFKTKRMPVRFLLYIAITALTRLLAIDIKEMADSRMIAISASILILSLSVLLIRFTSSRFPE